MTVVLPILIPITAAIICLICWNRPTIQRGISLTASGIAFGYNLWLLSFVSSSGIQTLNVAGWEAPFGVVLVADLLSAIMVLVTAFMGLMVAIYAIDDISLEFEENGYHILFQFLLAGVSGSFLTGDLFNLFVWFEIMLISSFVLLSMEGRRTQIEAGMKYVMMNLVSSAIFLSATGLVFGIAGTVNMADLGRRFPELAAENPVLTTSIAMLYVVAFGLKGALFPMFGWLPASYHTPPTAITTIFGALLTKVGVYALIRVFTLIFVAPEIMSLAQPVLLVLAALTMVTGVFGAVSQYDFRRLLSFHIISQIGYLILGLGIFTVASLAGTIFFMVHVILAKSALFLVSGIVNKMAGTYDLKKLGGFYHNNMALSMLFFIPAMALAGIPPLSGFWAKFAIVKAGLEAEQYIYVAIGLFVSVWTLYSMTKIWTYVFMRKRPAEYDTPLMELSANSFWLRWTPTLLIGAITVVMGLFAGPVFALATEAAQQLMDPNVYITAVLGFR
ncbi:MAG: multicomponent Na+:H+ antiporter subunit D [Cellvibrionaceae bacterium]|jgi:multicomponent Na+:H+ antiporter subunit D